jgi:hypothetical protein
MNAQRTTFRPAAHCATTVLRASSVRPAVIALPGPVAGRRPAVIPLPDQFAAERRQAVAA